MNSEFKTGKIKTIKEIISECKPGDQVRTQGLAVNLASQILSLQGLDNVSLIEIETDLINTPINMQSYYLVIGEVQLDRSDWGKKIIRAQVLRELVFKKYNVDYYEKEMTKYYN